jgi:hypothetical protein
VKQTELVVQYLSLARLHEHSTRLEIPKIKHAPTSLAASLEEYLNDKDFETNRRQYMVEREAKKSGGKSTSGTNKFPFDSKPTTSKTSTTSPTTDAPFKPAASAPLIDFFSSIQDNQQTMDQPPVQQYHQQTGFEQTGFQMPQQIAADGFPPPQQAFSPQSAPGTNPFAQMQQPQSQPQPQPLQTQFTGAGFGGYTPQPFIPQNQLMGTIPQNGMPSFMPPPQQQMPTIAEPLQPQQTSTNPFRQSMLPSVATGPAEPKLLNNPSGVASPGLSRSPTNPFAKHNTGFQQQNQLPNSMSPSPFGAMPSIQESQSTSPFPPQQQSQPLQPAPIATNPFAQSQIPMNNTPSPQGGLTVHSTGSTNPFRQSAFVNQQTGQGWQQTGNQGTLGGFGIDQVPTTNIFPRPGQQPGNYMS